MSSLQKKGDGWYCQFMFQRQRHTYTLGKVEDNEARVTAARIDYLLMRIKQKLLDVPIGVDILTFLAHDGKPPTIAGKTEQVSTTFAELRRRYLEIFGHGALENNTLYTAKIHLNHLAKTFDERTLLEQLGHADLQRHIDRRQDSVAPVTIKKEIDTFRAAWNWAVRSGLASGSFPGAGLVYPKEDEKLPFMTYGEIERRIKGGAVASDLWECLYLSNEEVGELLDHVRDRRISSWIYPALVLTAHTGARRSEMMRSKPEDVDLLGKVLTIRERKRSKGRRTTRRVPLSGRLLEVLTYWLSERDNASWLFGDGTKPLSPQSTQKAFERAVKKSKWDVLRGWHVLRHSFISALASRGVDQRLIDDFVGHQTEEQRRRYRHLYPSTQQEAIQSVFG